jgi:hypothetical protein
MRVAIVTENFLPKVDGVTRTLAMLLEGLHQRGHRALLVGPDGGPTPLRRHPRVGRARYPAPPLSRAASAAAAG